MKKQIALLSLTIFFLLPANALSQGQANAFSLSISVEQTALDWPNETKVRGKIQNNSGQTASLNGVTFHLKRYGAGRCTRGDCFAATFAFEKKKKLKNGESVEFEADLGDLHWRDEISSSYDFTEPKNMAWVIGRGSYYLFMVHYLPAKDSTKEAPRVLEIDSNEILMKYGKF